MEMHQVRYFLSVCEALNFTRAAKACHVAQPSLTAAIKKLEAELGGALFRRERSRTHLTELGKLLKPHLEQIYAASEAAKADAEDFRSLEKAEINLGVMSTIGPARMIGFIARLGCTVMPEFLPMLSGIATRPLVEPEVARHISLVTVAGRRQSPAVAALVRLARRYPWLH